MSADYAHTTWAQERRTQKAVRLEAYLTAHGWTPSLVEAASEAQRRQLERAAGVRRSSDETWALCVRLMRSAARSPWAPP